MFESMLDGVTREQYDSWTNGETPNGFLVENYEKNGKNGCLKYTQAKDGNLIGKYNLSWEYGILRILIMLKKSIIL